MSVWKDVPGVLTADPSLFKNVTKIDRLSYHEAIEMTYYGAKVIHSKTIKPLQNKNIPLYVKSFIDPDGEGTLISDIVEKPISSCNCFLRRIKHYYKYLQTIFHLLPNII